MKRFKNKHKKKSLAEMSDKYGGGKISSNYRSASSNHIDLNNFNYKHDWTYKGGYIGGSSDVILPPGGELQRRIDQLENELREAKERIRELEKEVEEKVIVI